MVREMGVRASKTQPEHWELIIEATPNARQPTIIQSLSLEELRALVRVIAPVAFQGDLLSYSDDKIILTIR